MREPWNAAGALWHCARIAKPKRMPPKLAKSSEPVTELMLSSSFARFAIDTVCPDCGCHVCGCDDHRRAEDFCE